MATRRAARSKKSVSKSVSARKVGARKRKSAAPRAGVVARKRISRASSAKRMVAGRAH